MDVVFTIGIGAYLALQVLVPLVASGGRRVASLVTLALPGWTLLALLAGSNLWPLPFVMFSPIAAIYLAVILILGMVFRADPPAPSKLVSAERAFDRQM